MATEEDVSLVREVCAIESERGSKIVAAGTYMNIPVNVKIIFLKKEFC